MRYLLSILMTAVSATSHEIVKDTLVRGHAPSPVFKDVKGTPAIPQTKELVSIKWPLSELEGEQCLHVEQMLDYTEVPLQDSDDGFVVVG